MLMVMSQRSNRTAGRDRAGAVPARVIAAAICAAAAAAPASGQYAARTVAGWTVAASKDGDGCFITRDFAANGGTSVLLGLDGDGANHLTLLNPHWSIEPKEKLKLTYRLSRGGYDDHFAVGIRSAGKRGFVSAFEAKFPGYFAASRALHVARGKVPVARVDLTGSGAAVAALRRCVAARKAGPVAAGTSGRETDIPQDPFARDARRADEK